MARSTTNGFAYHWLSSSDDGQLLVHAAVASGGSLLARFEGTPNVDLELIGSEVFAQRILGAPFVTSDLVAAAAELPGGVPSQPAIPRTAITEGKTVTELPDFDDPGTPPCEDETYEAEDMSHSTGGPTADGWNVWSNGFISTNHEFTGPTTVIVRAQGEEALGVWPNMVVRIDGVAIGSASVNSSDWKDYSFQFTGSAGNHEIAVEFTNDYYAPPIDRNLLVDRVVVGCETP